MSFLSFFRRLTISPMGLTPSSRVIIPLCVPEELSISKIWDLWLPNYISAESYAALNNNKYARYRIEHLLKMGARIPRAIQFIIIELKKSFDASKSLCMFEATSSEALQRFYDNIIRIFVLNFGRIRDCNMSPTLAHAILFEKEIALDADLMKMISSTLLVNSLTSFFKGQNIVPKTSMLSMKIFCAIRQNELYFQCIQHAIEKLEQLFYDTKLIDIGSFLEVAARDLINARLYVVKKLQSGKRQKLTVSIQEILVLKDIRSIKGASDTLIDVLQEPFSIPLKNSHLTKLTLPDSHEDDGRHFLSAANWKSEKLKDIVELKLNGKEACDSGWMFSTARDKKPFVLFLQCKSKRPSSGDITDKAHWEGIESSELVNTMNFTCSDLPQKGRQFLHLSELIKHDIAPKAKKGTMLEALQQGNYLYIYLETDVGSPSFAVSDHVMQLGAKDAMNFLSFLYDPYQFVRGTSFMPQKLDDNDRRHFGSIEEKVLN